MKEIKNPKIDELIKLWSRRFNFHFKNKELLVQSLVHDSYIQKENKKIPSNEKLEFLGDAVLGLIICSYLFEKFDSLNEGQLSKIKSHLVSKPVLYAIAKKMKIGDYLFLSEAEEREGGRKKPSIIADAVESIFGAIFLDQGMYKVKEFILYYYKDFLNSISLKSLDYKTTLQEFLQKKYKKLPVYKIVKESGPPHRRIFEISVVFENKFFEKGFGKSKKEAEQSAAQKALKKLKLL